MIFFHLISLDLEKKCYQLVNQFLVSLKFVEYYLFWDFNDKNTNTLEVQSI